MMHVQELVDLTIDFLHDSLADLKRCSLVGRSWLPASQYHLFSYLALEHELDCERLIAMRTNFPHLLGFITHLAIAFPPRNYDVLSNSNFTHLRELSIYTLPSKETLPILQSLVALPSVRNILVLRVDNPNLLLSFFSHRTANLGTLKIGPRHYRNERYFSVDEQDKIARPRLEVDCLHFSESGAYRSSSSFDLSSLSRLTMPADSATIHILRGVGSSLLDLEITGEIHAHIAHLNLGPMLPRLLQFTIHITSPAALSTIPMLLSDFTSGMPLQRVTLIVSRDCAPSFSDLSHFTHVKSWNAIDDTIASLGSVSLEVRVSLMVGGALESHVGVDALRACFPHLAKTRCVWVVATS